MEILLITIYIHFLADNLYLHKIPLSFFSVLALTENPASFVAKTLHFGIL